MSAAPGAPVRTLVVDDEPLARRTLQVLLAGAPGVEVVGECTTGAQAVAALREREVDLLFLDVQMPDMDGFEVLREAGAACRAAVVFVTAYDAFAVRAFEARAVHYLLKPFDDERFERVLGHALEHVRGVRVQGLARQLAGLVGGGAPAPAPLAAPALAPGPGAERLALRDGERVVLLPVEQIDFIEAEDYCTLVHAGPRSHLVRQSLRELEGQLDPRRFLRIHRSTIVNVARVKELRPLQRHGEYWVVLQDGRQLKLSRSYRDQLDALLRGR